jgi:hypothetical protein
MAIEAPEIGRWYCGPDGNLFKIVATDDAEGTIEMQHFDGTLEETGPEEWLSMRPDSVDAPEDWSGSVDICGEDMPGMRRAVFRDWHYEIEMLDDDNNQITEFE